MMGLLGPFSAAREWDDEERVKGEQTAASTDCRSGPELGLLSCIQGQMEQQQQVQ